MRLRLQKLQKDNNEAQRFKQQKPDGYKKINKIFYYQNLLFVPKAIWTELITRHKNNPLVGPYGIEKTHKLLA